MSFHTGWVTTGHSAMLAHCPVRPKANTAGRFMSTRPGSGLLLSTIARISSEITETYPSLAWHLGKIAARGAGCGSFLRYHFSTPSGGRTMRLEDHFGNGSILQRNERVKLAASFWNNIGAGMVIGGMAAAFFLDKPEGTWTKIGIAIAGLVLGWLCYSIASNILTNMHTVPEERR